MTAESTAEKIAQLEEDDREDKKRAEEWKQKQSRWAEQDRRAETQRQFGVGVGPERVQAFRKSIVTALETLPTEGQFPDIKIDQFSSPEDRDRARTYSQATVRYAESVRVLQHGDPGHESFGAALKQGREAIQAIGKVMRVEGQHNAASALMTKVGMALNIAARAGEEFNADVAVVQGIAAKDMRIAENSHAGRPWYHGLQVHKDSMSADDMAALPSHIQTAWFGHESNGQRALRLARASKATK